MDLMLNVLTIPPNKITAEEYRDIFGYGVYVQFSDCSDGIKVYTNVQTHQMYTLILYSFLYISYTSTKLNKYINKILVFHNLTSSRTERLSGGLKVRECQLYKLVIFLISFYFVDDIVHLHCCVINILRCTAKPVLFEIQLAHQYRCLKRDH